MLINYINSFYILLYLINKINKINKILKPKKYLINT